MRSASAALLVAAAAVASIGQARADTFSSTTLSYDAAMLSQFNLISLGNVTNTGTAANNANIDGRAVIGGNLTVNGTASTICGTNCAGNTSKQFDANNYTYGAGVVFGNVLGGNGISVAGAKDGGAFNVFGNQSGKVSAVYDAVNGSGAGSTVTGNVVTTRSTFAGTATGSVNTNINLAYVFPYNTAGSGAYNTFGKPMLNLAQGIAALPGTPGVTAQALPSSNATFFTANTDYTYNGKSYGVVTTTLANLAQQGSGFTGVKNGASDAATLVIVTGDGANYLLPSLTYSDPNVIYDFVNATTLRFSGSWTGSILAPLATITQQGGTINGTVVVAGINQTMELLSTDAFTGDISGLTGVQYVPEPSSLALLGAGIAGIALIRRRRK